MNVTITDSRALQRLRPLEVAAYLRTRGWHEEKRIGDKGLIMVQPEQEGEVLLVLRDDLGDYAHRMSDLVTELARVESRPQTSVYTDLLNSGMDVVRLRVARDAADGTLQLGDARALVDGSWDMLTAAALAAVKPKAVFRGKQPEEASDYLKRVRMGQTERGSFILNILCPAVPELAGDDGLENPFDNRVTETLASALGSAREMAVNSALAPGVDHIARSVAKGVSANLCMALTEMGRIMGGDSDVEVNFRWANTRSRAASLPRQVILDKASLRFVESAGAMLRLRAEEDDFSLSGFVVRLTSPHPGQGGEVVVQAPVEDRWRNVTLLLDSSEYQTAVDAHKTSRRITAIGTLSKEGNKWKLRDSRDFQVEDEE
jgi:hypothetical protein